MEDLFSEQVEQSFTTERITQEPLQTFSFDEKQNSKIITLEQLKQTREVLKNHRGKLPPARPMEHTQFIELVQEMVDKVPGTNQLAPEIYVSKSDSHYESKIAAAYQTNNALPAWLFERLICRIPFSANSNSDYNPAIAIGYNARGIALAFGTNVRICQNMSIFGEKFLKTYDEGLPFNRMMELFKNWIGAHVENYEHDLGVLRNMKSTFLGNTKEELQKMVGLLHMNATARNMGRKIIAPLNQTQVNDFSRKIIEMVESGNINIDSPEVININDLYQIGTNILTHSQTNLEYKWDRVSDMGTFFETYYLS